MNDLTPLTDAVRGGNRNESKCLTQAALDALIDPRDVLVALVAGMDEIGRRFQRNEAFVPEMLIAARAMKEAMSVLEPILASAGITPQFTAVIGTVQGDLHDIGKNLVAMMWRGANFRVVDLGTNVPPDRFITAVRENNAQVVGLSALLTTTMPAMKQTVAEIRQSGVDCKILVGGAPITEEFAGQIGADAFAPDAASAVNLVRQLVPG